MKESTLIKNNKTEDIQMVTDFKDELERIKQKLAKDFSKYSELEKMKNKQKLTGRAIIFRKTDTNNNQKEISDINDNNDFFEKIHAKEDFDIKYNNIEKDDKINSKSNDYINKYRNNNTHLSSINTHNINPLNYNILFRKKYIDISNEEPEEENDLNFSFTNDLNKQRNLSTDNNNKTKIINNNINININNNSSLILDSKLDQQIKFIDEKSENNRIEEEKTIQKIKQIENRLQLEERLTHNNREIRKNAIKELIDMCQKDFENSQDKQKMFEFFSPWIKYCLGETNSYVIPECLNFFIVFNNYFPGYLSTSFKNFFDNAERFISFGVYGINELCNKIFLMIFEDKKLNNQAFSEFMKLLIKSSSINVYKFIQDIILLLLNKNLIQENNIKTLFEKVIQIYININKNNEKKKIFSQLINNIYKYIEDDYDNIKKNIKLSSYKELDSLFAKINSSNTKKNFITYTLYPRPLQTDTQNIKSFNNYFNYNILDLNDRIKTEESFDNNKYNYYESKIKKKIFEKKNNGGYINNKGEVNDLISILPNEFFEYHFEVQFQAKMQILENANELLNKIKYVKDKEKNLIDVYKTVSYSIEDSNILIHLEGIKLLENICRLINEFINKQKLKIVLERCFDKLKDKKSLVKNELFKLFTIVIECNCLELNKFISFILHHCLNEKNENIKIGLLEFIKSIFSQESLKILKCIDDITEKEFLYYSKKIVNIITKESLSSIKDICTELLIILKRKIISIKSFNEIIKDLPNNRKKLIQRQEKIDSINSSYSRRNYKQKKSSYSLTNIKKGNYRNNLSISNVKSNNSSFRNDSFKSNKINNEIKDLKKFKKINLYTNTNYANKNKNIRNITRKDNFNDKMNISFNSSPRVNQKIKNKSVDYNKLINKTEISEDNNYNINNLQNSNEYLISQRKNKKVDSSITQKNNLIKSIDSINEDSIEKFSKIIIKDFISFIKKASLQHSEDLSPHFELIFIIYEKIFQRIFYFMGKNKSQKQNVIKLKKLLDELIIYVTKILIITPGIEQIRGCTKFDQRKLDKYLSIFKNFSFSEEKYYMDILLNLYKLCEGKDEDFPEKYEPKFSVIYFLNYIKKANKDLNSKKILNILKEFIAESEVLSLEEKNILLEDIQLTDIDYEKEIELINQLKPEKKEENINNTINTLNESDSNSDSDDENINKNKNGIKINEIENSIKLFSNSLSKLPIKGLGNKDKKENIEKTEMNKINDNIIQKNKVIDNNEIKKNMSALNIPFSLLKNKLTLNNTKKLSLNLQNRENHSFEKTKKEINHNEINNKTEILKTEVTEPKNDVNYKSILNQIIKSLNNEITEEGIFSISLLHFFKLNNTQKIDFINTLQNLVSNNSKNNILQNTSLNILLNFFDYILTILSFQILKFPKEESLIIKLQNFIQSIISIRYIDDIFKIMLFLLKKYFPKDLNKKIEDMSLVIIKIISYFLKELLKKAKKQKIIGYNLICEINDLFINTPPSNLTTKTPNCSVYQNVFTLLKSITDEIAFQNKDKFSEIISYLKEKRIVCEEYVQYLIKLNNNLNK